MRARIIVVACAIGLAACGGPEAAKSSAPAPAKVERPVKESELNTITLTPEAEKRLGIVVEAIAERRVPESRVVAGEVVVPAGMSVDVTAPVAGTLGATSAGPPRAGSRVRRGEPLFRLAPLLPADRDIRINAERDLETAAAALQATEQKAARAKQLLEDGSGSRRSFEEALAELKTARATHEAAVERMTLVKRTPVGEAGDLVVAAPFDGLIEQLYAAPGQTVAASARLGQVVRADRLWVRVPLYAGDAREASASRSARVLRLGDPPDAPGSPAQRVAAPPSADPSASAVDLVFELAEARGPGPDSGRFSPGERVMVRLEGPLGDAARVIDEGALLHDIHGGIWVYERVAPQAYARRRVEVKDTVGGVAVLARGPATGAMVVTVGAAELYGVEFGAGK